jgi:hypothetical protein
VVVDLGYRNIPVDELRISSSTPRYARSFTVRVRGDVVAAGELVRVGRTKTTIVPLAVRTRFLTVEIDNGDDPPLRGIRVDVLAQPRTLLVESGHPAPLRCSTAAAFARRSTTSHGFLALRSASSAHGSPCSGANGPTASIAPLTPAVSSGGTCRSSRSPSYSRQRR